MDWYGYDLGDVERAAVFVTAISAGLVAVLSLLARLRRGFRRGRAWWADVRARAQAVERLIQHELNPNSGSSIKDAVNRNSERLDRLEQHLGVVADAQANVWPAIEAVARARPPEDEENRT